MEFISRGVRYILCEMYYKGEPSIDMFCVKKIMKRHTLEMVFKIDFEAHLIYLAGALSIFRSYTASPIDVFQLELDENLKRKYRCAYLWGMSDKTRYQGNLRDIKTVSDIIKKELATYMEVKQ